MRKADHGLMRTLALAAAVLLVTAGGCTTVAPSVAVRDELGVVAIAPAAYVPETNFVTFAMGKGAGAAKGAALEGGSTAAGAALVAAAAAPIAAPVILFAGAVASIAMTIHGAWWGARQSIPEAEAKQISAVIGDAVAKLDAQDELANRLATMLDGDPWIHLSALRAGGPSDAASRPDYSGLRTAGVDTVLEVAVQRIMFADCESWDIAILAASCGMHPKPGPVSLFMSAQARLVRVSDGTELFLGQYRSKSPRRDLERWVTSDGRLLAEAFEQAYRETAERIHDDIFLNTPIRLPAPSSFGLGPTAKHPHNAMCWLTPIYPGAGVVGWSNREDGTPGSVPGYTIIDSLRPTLRWSAFPRDLDREELDPLVLQAIANVTYDLRIWATENDERGALVYERTGLVLTEHTMDEALQPGERYFWSVRARFTIDGRRMATRWAHANAISCNWNDLADGRYHRFVTPP